jgi:DNA-binding transcriptional MerR regulator
MGTLLTRSKVAEQLNVCPTTIYRWEKRTDCPIKPKRLKRNGELRYTQEDVDALRNWMNEFEDADAA